MLSAASLVGPEVQAQLGAVDPPERVQAGTPVNAFVTWQGGRPLEGLTMDLPTGWRLDRVTAVGENAGSVETLRVVPSARSAGRFHALAPQTLRGAQRLILGIEVGTVPGEARIEITPVRRRDEDNRLVLMSSWRSTWTVTVAERPRTGSGQAYRRGAGSPLVLNRRGLPRLDGRAAYTIEAWVRTTGLDEVLLSAWDGREGEPYPAEWTLDPRGRLVVYRGEPGRHVGMKTSEPVADGQWHHVAVVQDPERGWVRLFLDGVPADSLRLDAASLIDNRLPLALGGRWDARDAGGPYTGLLDELRLWNRVRSADEIRFTMRRQLDEPVEGLVRLGFEQPVPDDLLAAPVRERITVSSDLSFSYPIEMLQADVHGPSVRVTWETKDRQNVGFTVERSLDGRAYTPLGRLRVQDRIAEAADGTMRFAFTDTPPDSPLLYYRIQQRFADAPPRASGALKLGIGADGSPLAVLEGNTPNPFVGQTTITFDVREAAPVRLSVWDVSGSRIAVLVDESLGAGRHQVQFNAGNLPSGVYFVQLQTPESRLTHKMTLQR